MTALPPSPALTQFVMSRRKPQAKSLSPAARCLFGRSEGPSVQNNWASFLTTERKRGISELNFDVYTETPVNCKQQENISDLEKAFRNRRRYQWKLLKAGEGPEYYSRAFYGKRSLIPAAISSCSPKSVGTDGVNQSKKILSESVDRNGDASPLRSPPSHFCDSAKSESISLQKPVAVHATSVNALTVKNVTPSNKTKQSLLFARSPLTQRNQSGFCKALNFTSIHANSTSISTNASDERQSNSTPASETSSEITRRTPKSAGSAHSAMKQLKITDMATIRKPRLSVMKARKRLRLRDESEGSPQPKSHKLVKQRGVSNA